MKGKIRKSCNNNENHKKPKIKTKTSMLDVENFLQPEQQAQIQCFKSDTILSGKENFSREELSQAFYTISQGKQHIIAQDLSDFLADEHQSNFKKFEMIRLIDKGNKGYVNKEEFLQFYQNHTIASESKKIPVLMRKRKEWITFLENNYNLFQNLIEEDFCKYIVSEIKKQLDYPINQ